MSIQRNDWSLQRKGIIDQERHKDRVKEAIRKNLGSIVSNEAIILSDGKRTVKVPIKALDEYKFRFNYQKSKHVGQGDGILVEKQCYGFMTPDRFTDGEDLWMIATGTGVGPFISMLRDPYVWEKFRNLILVHGVRRAEEFAYRDELASYCLHALTAASSLPSKAAVRRLVKVTLAGLRT